MSNYTLHPHQQQAVEFSKNRDRFCLAMDMRTGKTLTSLHILLKERKHEKLLVIAPKKVLSVWSLEMMEKLDVIPEIVTSGDEARSASKFPIIISPRLVQHLKVDPDAVICDEVHLYKGGEQYKQILKKTDSAKSLIVLSATTVNNRPKDLYATLRLVKHQSAYSKEGVSDSSMKYSFLHTFCRSGTITIKGRNIHQFNGVRNKDILSKHVRECFFFYKNTERIQKQKTTVEITLMPDQREKYDRSFQEYLQEQRELGRYTGGILSARNLIQAIKCREYLCYIKAKHFVSIFKMLSVTEKTSHIKGQPIVIFASFVTAQNILLAGLPNATSDIDTWKEEGGQLVMSHRKGGAGVDLSNAYKMYLIDLDVRPKDNSQAMGRILGPNQKSKHVIYTFLHCPETIDDRIVELNYEKLKQIQSLGL